MTISIIVARYNEDVSWTKQFPNVVIFNKGQPLGSEYNEIFLQNVGREGHTYYSYIVDNYDKLGDYIIFLQGNPFDHSPNIIRNMNVLLNKPEEFKFLSEQVLHCNLSGCAYHRGIPLIPVYEKLFKEKKTHLSFIFGAGAQFIVSKQRILKRTREFYQEVVKLLEYDVNPIEGFVIERFHGLIFS
jgi:hypothetical protein